ncbi:MAG: amidohydrolase family protein [Deltaproteobacteria bacterium]|nr:amidohydrolase family protein [Deltaproteobacteria bacterium]
MYAAANRSHPHPSRPLEALARLDQRRSRAGGAALRAESPRTHELQPAPGRNLLPVLPAPDLGRHHAPPGPRTRGTPRGSIATRSAHSGVETLIEIALEDELHTEFRVRAAMHGSEEIAHEIIRHPQMLVGASDAGAHLSQFCGAGDACYFLAEYVRKRGVFSLEEAIHRITGQPAELFAIADRGRIEVGRIADLVLFDPDRIDVGPERFVRDLPGDAARYVREPFGVHSVLVGGEVVVNEGSYTSARPGRIV